MKTLPIEIETNEYCGFGCNNIAKFKTAKGKFQCNKSANSCPVNKKKNSDAIKIAHKEGRIPGWNDIPNQNRGWSKGLTKETDPRILKRSLIHKENIRSGETIHKSYPCSEVTKKKLSISQTKYLEKGIHLPWIELLPGFKVQGMWEYNVGKKLIKDGFSLSRFHLIYDGHRRYTPDFCIGENIFVEVKGWLSDRDKIKYRKFFEDNNNVLIYLIRDELGIKNYTKFLNDKITIFDCENLKEILGC